MKKAFGALAASLALAFAGCSADTNEELGALKANLTLPDGTTLSSINYSITGGPTTRNGVVNVLNSATAQFREGSLLPGAGYSIALAATTTSLPSVPCAGTGGFSITAGGVATLTMNMVCGGGVVIDVNGNGDVEVDINVTNVAAINCPVVAGISANPLEVFVGSDIALLGTATASTTGATYAWAGPGGVFSAATALATNYTCGTAGDHIVTFTISKTGCVDSAMPVTLTCTGLPTGGTGGVGGTSGTGGVGGTSGTGGTGGTSGTGGTGGGPTAPITGLTVSCGTCVDTQCGVASIYGYDFMDACFNGGNGPAHTQACTDAFVCSMNSSDLCWQNTAAGPFECYCGLGAVPGTCQTSGPLPTAQCVTEWEVATQCPTGDSACVMGNFSSGALPSGDAFYAIECMHAGGCAASCP